MSTNCTITGLGSDGKRKTIFCYWDGYKSHVGAILHDHYTDTSKVAALIDLGNLSSLGTECDCPQGHSWETPVAGKTVAYHRDRGEELRFNGYGEQSYNYSHNGYFWRLNGRRLKFK